MNFEFEYFLRRYIDIAIRWQISTGTLKVLQWSYENARTEWEKFKEEFRLVKRNFNENERSNFYDDLVSDFYPMIDGYVEFYNQNLHVINQNANDKINPYSVLLELCIDTKREIEILNKPNISKNSVVQDEDLLSALQLARSFDKISDTKNKSKITSFLLKHYWYFVLPLLVTILALLCSKNHWIGL